ncbi:MAG TPA: rhamnogalacturonan acetylesterase [Gemmatimonadaceae bacterium]|jgi:lysophospholipase L1-like esterase|nr:rhamnogalacturonan acetylesterase [Gemmatimonadaceae bacterium]
MRPPLRFPGARLAPVAALALTGFVAPPITVWLAGDSTMAQKQPDKRPETGWGEALQPCFDSTEVRIANRAVNGRSTRSFIDEGRWAAIVDSLHAGDYVLVQFGHNDEKVGTDRYASPEDYARNLARFAADVRARGAHPVLLTPVVRRAFDGSTLRDTHGAYPDAARRVAREQRVPLIDMTRASAGLVQRLGPDASRALWLHLEPGVSPNYPAGVHDDTHFDPEGARAMAGLALDAMTTAVPALAAHERGCAAKP